MTTDLNKLVELAASRHASDIHLICGLAPKCRVDGVIVDLCEGAVDEATSEAYARELLGSGSLLGIQIVPEALYDLGYMNNGMMTMPAMALIICGCVIWAHRAINDKK